MTIFSASAVCAASPIGRWTTYDLDKTPRSVIEVFQSGATLFGRIVKLLKPKNGEVTDPLCTQCKGSNKNKAKVGMVVISGLKKSGDRWTNGKIINADDGKTYDCEISLAPTGKILYFRGYQGVPFLGKTIAWDREQRTSKTIR